MQFWIQAVWGGLNHSFNLFVKKKKNVSMSNTLPFVATVVDMQQLINCDFVWKYFHRDIENWQSSIFLSKMSLNINLFIELFYKSKIACNHAVWSNQLTSSVNQSCVNPWNVFKPHIVRCYVSLLQNEQRRLPCVLAAVTLPKSTYVHIQHYSFGFKTACSIFFQLHSLSSVKGPVAL